MTDNITLLPCPFCGDEGDKGVQEVTMMTGDKPKFNRITCRSCGAMCPEHNWNIRAALAVAAQAEPVACQYGVGGYACCEGGPCKADEQNNATAPQPAQPVALETHDAMCPALDGGRCNCSESPVSIDKAWARFCGKIGRGKDAPYPGMIEAFEAHYGQSFCDKDWRTETAVWAAAWKAAMLAAPQPAQPVAVPHGWKEAAIAWEVCGSIHRTWAKGKDALYTTRQADFSKHAEDARAMLNAAHTPPAATVPVLEPLTQAERGRLILATGDKCEGLPQDDWAEEIIFAVEAAHAAKLAKLNGSTPPAEGSV